jgi:hypothetical protein
VLQHEQRLLAARAARRARVNSTTSG